MEYKITETNVSDSQASNFTVVYRNSTPLFPNQTYWTNVNVSTLGTYFMFIKAKNEYDSFVYSWNVSVTVDFPCELDNFNVTKEPRKL